MRKAHLSAAALAALLLCAGCAPGGIPVSSTRQLEAIGGSPNSTLRYGINYGSTPPLEEDWSIVAWPEMRPLEITVSIEEDPTFRNDYIVELNLVEEPPGDWIGVIYSGERNEQASPPSGVPLSENRWLWRYYTSPEIVPDSLDLAETPIELYMIRPVQEPETSDVVELRETGHPPCATIFMSPDTSVIHFDCPEPLIPPVNLQIEIREGLFDLNGRAATPRVLEFEATDIVHHFIRFPPPVEGDLCVERGHYFPYDCTR